MAADPLAPYNAKRDFAKTAEPKGKRGRKGGNRFIVQKHDATRLHWDFRLEIDGVLKSWAVTRGPSLDPAQKRLAVRTEDHPLSYADFEGVIPKGEYGGGTVMLWDRGTWAPVEGKTAADLDEGHLHFTLSGERMRGEWLLVRLRPRGRETRENWLLRKVEDAEAGGADTLVETGLTSVATGRTMEAIAEGMAPPKPSAARKAKGAPPKFRKPQLATLVDAVPAGNGWIHEMKYDGYRALVAVGGGRARVFTRSGLDWSDKFPGIVAAAAALPVDTALIDGEIVAFRDGRPDFATLQAAIGAGGHDVTLFAFDLLSLDGEDLAALPQTLRKDRLRAAIDGADAAIRFAEHITGAGEALFERLCREGLEGIVSKRADAPYRGARTRDWLKVKCTRRQEFVIVGAAASSAKGRPFASLLLAQREGDALRYAGRVGTGFDAATMDDLARRMRPLARKTPPLDVPRAAARDVQWLRPELVAEVAFAEFTGERVVRHASFIGLRADKAAGAVTREQPAPAPPARPASGITLTSPDRVVFPGDGITKRQLAEYYDCIAPLLLPALARRPISLVRCPQGRAKQCFFQKHDAGSFGEAVHHVAIREKDGSTEPYLWIDDAEGIRACVQMGTIEFHGWGARSDDVERPDRMVFDLDPDEALDFADIRRAAEHLKRRLADLGLASFAMLSGGKGIHVVVPLTPGADWPQVKSFAERFARVLATAEPDRFTATMSKAKRKGRIFIDWLRNQRGSTAVLPYVVRARPGAPVAAPVAWSELGDIDAPDAFTLRDADTLIARAAARTLAGWGIARQVLPDV